VKISVRAANAGNFEITRNSTSTELDASREPYDKILPLNRNKSKKGCSRWSKFSKKPMGSCDQNVLHLFDFAWFFVARIISSERRARQRERRFLKGDTRRSLSGAPSIRKREERAAGPRIDAPWERVRRDRYKKKSPARRPDSRQQKQRTPLLLDQYFATIGAGPAPLKW
jgi:hypothetical protein